MKIWNGLNKFRGDIINLVCESATIISKLEADSGNVGNKYSFKDPMLGQKEANTQFISPSEIESLLEKKGALKTVPEKDARFIIDLYAAMCKNDFSVDKETGEEFHWIGRTFDHAPGVAVLAAISSLQKEVLKARSEVMIYLQSEIGGSDYSFDKVVGLARPLDPIVAGGQEFFVEIQAAAYDSQREPEVDTEGQGQVVSIKNGVALVKFRAPSSGEMNIKGTVSVKKKTGTPVELPYSTQVMVAPKSGSLELPEFSLLYRGYGNIIIPSANGAVSTSLSAPGCQVTPTTFNGRKGFKVTPGAGTSVTLTLSGKDREGKSIQYGKWPYKVTNMPNPSIQQTSISKSGGKITVKIDGSPLNVSFKYVSVECDDYSGPGNLVPGSALSKFRAGKKVPVLITVVNSLTGKQITVGNSLKVTN
jgi:gliding motility-associated protein GldM